MESDRGWFFEHAGVPLAVLDEAGLLVAANGALRREAGRTTGALWELVAAADRDAARAAFEGAQRDGTGSFEASFEGTGPSRVHYAFRIDRGDERAPYVVTSWDVTAVHRERERMRVLARMLEATPVVLTAADEAGTITLSDGKGLSALGFAPGEVIGLDIHELYRDSDLEAPLVRAYAGENVFARCSFPGGATFDHWYTPVLGPEGSVEGVIGIAVDTTAQTAAERELSARLDEISQKDATIRALAAPILQVWDGVLCVPLVGAVDDARASAIMETLLAAIVARQARWVVLDLTGVELLDTSSAAHVLQIFRAAAVLGVSGLVSGLQPHVAQTLVGLGVSLDGIRATLSLAEALRICIQSDSAGRSRGGRAASGSFTRRF